MVARYDPFLYLLRLDFLRPCTHGLLWSFFVWKVGTWLEWIPLFRWMESFFLLDLPCWNKGVLCLSLGAEQVEGRENALYCLRGIELREHVLREQYQ